MKTTLGLAIILSLGSVVLPRFSVTVQAQPPDSCGTTSGLCWPKLSRGEHGYQTKTLQTLLTVRGVPVKADGIFGATTLKAVRTFQQRKHLKVDGIVGWQTWEKLVVEVGKGSRGFAVSSLQDLLAGKDYPVKSDGYFGEQTRDAVRDYQQSIGITTVNGRATPAVWCYLLEGHADGE